MVARNFSDEWKHAVQQTFADIGEIMIYRLQEVLDMAKTAKSKRNIKFKLNAAKCLLCEREADPKRRGLCHYHYHQFDNAKRKLVSKKKQDDFDREQVRAGNILESRRGRTPKEPNAFAS